MITTRQARQILHATEGQAADALRRELFDVSDQDSPITEGRLMDTLNVLPTKHLVELYNAHTDKPIKRFSDRKTAERRVLELLASANAEQPLAEGGCPLCGGDASSQTANGAEGTRRGDEENFCHECEGAYHRATGARRAAYDAPKSAARSEAIAASWKDPAVAARRAARLKVNVDGADYRSVPQAFRALGLPMAKHIQFRGQLRDALALDFEHNGHTHRFALITAE